MEKPDSLKGTLPFAQAVRSVGAEYSPAAFWFLYGDLDSEEMARQLSEMVDKGVYQGFLHPRAYLKTPYLEDEWWGAMGAAIEHARKIGFSPWLYDEYAWPSGTAGSVFKYSSQKPSRVLAAGEKRMAKSLVPELLRFGGENREPSPSAADAAPPFCAASFRTDAAGRIVRESLRRIEPSEATADGTVRNEPSVMVFRLNIHPLAVDYLNAETVRAFIDSTHEEYYTRFGADFGKLIPGIFFDEIFNPGSPVVWTAGFEAEFRERRGYDPLPLLPLLIMDGDEGTEAFRKDYHRTVAELYEEAFFKQIGDWCADHGLLLTGHTEEWIAEHPLRQGDYFRTLRHLQIPGADCHDYRYRYPRLISPVEPKGAVSVARAKGRPRVMSEALGGGGWATSLQEFKRGVNVLAAMGINFFVLHGFAYENDHQGSQADWPVSFFFQNPYWRHFRLFSSYIARLSLLGSLGRAVCRVGILYPIASMWERFRDGRVTERGKLLAGRYNAVLEELLRHQIDADLLDEAVIIGADLSGGRLAEGEEAFELVAIPGASGLSEPALEKLRRFEEAGGRILVYDVGDAGQAALLARFASPIRVDDPEKDLIQAVRSAIESDFRILGEARRDVFYYRREYRGTSYWLVVNGSPASLSFDAVFGCGGKPFKLDIETGKIAPLPAEKKTQDQAGTRRENGHGGEGTAIRLSLHADQALCVFFEPGESAPFSDADDTAPPPLLPETAAEGAAEAATGIAVLELPSEGWILKPLPARPPVSVPSESAAIASREGESVLMELTHADFRTDLRDEWERIRIENRRGEGGRCGRHVTPWKGRWITRRPSWADDSCEGRLYFRKTFSLEGKPKRASLCVAAVNRYAVYVNGRLVRRGEGWKKPATIAIGSFLQPGRNLIAVGVENDTPLPGKNMLEAETFDPDALTSLLAQLSVETESGALTLGTDDSWICRSSFGAGWQEADTGPEESAAAVDLRGISFPWGLERPDRWIYAWSRGTPPLLPWGPLPLFGKDIEWPRRLEYRLVLPRGVGRVYRPAVRGEASFFLAGSDATEEFAEKGYADVPAAAEERIELGVAVVAEGPEDGLAVPIAVGVREERGGLPDWRELGWEYYSGEMEYRTTFDLPDFDFERCELDLGDVRFHAEVFVNGRNCGTRIWRPYRYDIGGALRPGVNELWVAVSNLAAPAMSGALLDEGRALGWNRYWYGENIDRDEGNLRSGLFGPARLLFS